jgi:hypothetical protein
MNIDLLFSIRTKTNSANGYLPQIITSLLEALLNPNKSQSYVFTTTQHNCVHVLLLFF